MDFNFYIPSGDFWDLLFLQKMRYNKSILKNRSVITMDFKSGTCPKCGKHNVILPSNNPLAPSICNYCVVSNLDYNNIEDGDFFCRTYNYPFNPEKWVKLAAMYKKDVFKEYISWVKEEFLQEYEVKTKDIWKELNEEWALARLMKS